MTAPAVQLPWSVHEALLANGLKVLIQPVHTAPLVSVWCWYRVGSGDEGTGFTGISHWVEHMNFKGTEHIPRDQMKSLIERFGGFWNGYTWIDQTTYLETAAREALDQMLFIESERMARCLYDPAECESERTVIISELEGNENDPDHLLEVEVTAAAFKAHPYGHPTIGWIGDLRRLTRDDLYGYYRRHYVPNNATLVIAGDVTVSEATALVERHFGAIEPGVLSRAPRTEEPEQRGERRVTITREGTTAYLKAAFHAPGVNGSDFFALLLLDAILAGAKGLNLWHSFRTPPPQRSSRLYRALVDRQLASSVTAALLPTRDPFLYTISITATESTPLSRVEDVLLTELDRAAREGVTAAELRKARNQLRARLVFENDSVTNIAHQLGFFETVASWSVLLSAWDRIEAVTLDEVNAAATRYLRAANRTIGWFEPVPVHASDPAGARA